MSKFLDSNGLLYLWEKLTALLGNKVDKAEGKGLSANDFTDEQRDKLAGLSNYTHPTGSGSFHIPSGGASGQVLRWSADGEAEWGEDQDTLYAAMTGATEDAAGEAGLAPAPPAGAQDKYLCGDGTWQTPPAATYEAATSSASGLMSAADKTKLDAFAAAENYALKSELTSVYRYKGSKATVADLPETGNATGDVWDVAATGMNYGWTGTAWDALGSVLTVEAISNTDIDTVLAS